MKPACWIQPAKAYYLAHRFGKFTLGQVAALTPMTVKAAGSTGPASKGLTPVLLAMLPSFWVTVLLWMQFCNAGASRSSVSPQSCQNLFWLSQHLFPLEMGSPAHK